MDEPSQTDEQTVAKPEPVVNSNPKPSQTPEKGKEVIPQQDSRLQSSQPERIAKGVSEKGKSPSVGTPIGS
ncbi:hypothetical protein RhiirA5_361824, partial [Rhizophagus irregularis]